MFVRQLFSEEPGGAYLYPEPFHCLGSHYVGQKLLLLFSPSGLSAATLPAEGALLPTNMDTGFEKPLPTPYSQCSHGSIGCDSNSTSHGKQSINSSMITSHGNRNRHGNGNRKRSSNSNSISSRKSNHNTNSNSNGKVIVIAYSDSQ